MTKPELHIGIDYGTQDTTVLTLRVGDEFLLIEEPFATHIINKIYKPISIEITDEMVDKFHDVYTRDILDWADKNSLPIISRFRRKIIMKAALQAAINGGE